MLWGQIFWLLCKVQEYLLIFRLKLLIISLCPSLGYSDGNDLSFRVSVRINQSSNMEGFIYAFLFLRICIGVRGALIVFCHFDKDESHLGNREPQLRICFDQIKL